MTRFLGLVEKVIIKYLSNGPEMRPYEHYHVYLQHYLETHLVALKRLLEVNEQDDHRIIITVSFPIRGRGPGLSAVIV